LQLRQDFVIVFLINKDCIRGTVFMVSGVIPIAEKPLDDHESFSGFSCDGGFMERFWNKVNKSGKCWEWTAGKDSKGYGLFKLNGKMVLAHRRSWILTNGEIPLGMGILHKCDNPSCVNPKHLFIGNHQTNMADRDLKERGRNIIKKNDFQLLVSLKEHKTSIELARFFNCHKATINRTLNKVLRPSQESN